MQARSWKSLHGRAVQRLQWTQAQLRVQSQQAEQREAALRGQLELAQAKIRDLQQRLFGRFENAALVGGGEVSAARARHDLHV